MRERELHVAGALGLDEEDDAAPHREVLAGVAPREPVDDPERLVALAGLHDPAADPGAPVRVVVVRDREGDAGVALEVPRLAAPRLREERDPFALQPDPDRHAVRRAVREQRREVPVVAALEELADLGGEGHARARCASAGAHDAIGEASPSRPFRRR